MGTGRTLPPPCQKAGDGPELPGEHTARLPFSAHGTIQTHKPSLSYLVPTYSWVESARVREEHNVGAYSATTPHNCEPATVN